VRFEVMNMPDTTGYGSYVECGQAGSCAQDEVGEYIIGMYLDICRRSRRAASSARFRRNSVRPKLFVDSDTLSERWTTHA